MSDCYDTSDELKHYGVKRKSGRYPWGSGEDPYQRSVSFLGNVSELKKKGLSEVEIAKGMDISTSDLRARKTISREEKRRADVSTAQKLKEKGMSNVAIGQQMGINESSVRNLLNPIIQAKTEVTRATSTMLKDQVAEKKYLDVGLGVESHLGISGVKLNAAISELQQEGYGLHYIDVEQVGMPGKYTSMKVLAAPGTEYRDVYNNRDQIRTVNNWSDDGGRSYLGLKPPLQVDSKRVMIRYAEDGGKDKDGVIELRRNTPDLTMGDSQYAQVRIGVNGTHYLKGMAIKSDNMPDGTDIIFNTNKKKADVKSDLDAMKPIKKDEDNPFGATVRQILDPNEPDPNKKKVVSALNIVNEEGDWDTWSRNISSQVLSKQPPALAKKQLGLAYDLKKDELKDINSLNNPVVKKLLLEKFADGADSDAVNLKAAALPRQSSRVILPLTKIKENEIYAPSYNNGEQVVLIRHPHGGIFEIPPLTVNNKSKEALSIMKNAKDAVGIHPKVAEKLSGADFDGDNVIVIPNNSKHGIKTQPTLKALENFDPKTAYAPYEGMKTIDGGIMVKGKKETIGNKPLSGALKQAQMGQVSNLITDMTIKGAHVDEIARAVKHSMVVIDSEKHNLNYKQSAIDNNIAELKTKYQGGPRSGASTLISRASSEYRVPERTPGAYVINPLTGKQTRMYTNPVTGEKLYTPTGATYVDKKGKTVVRTTPSTKMAEAHNAYDLSSGTTMEGIYATHANNLKSLANEARKQALNTKMPMQSSSAKIVYKPEVDSLKSKLSIVLQNKPMERQAQLLANHIVTTKQQANPSMDKAELKKIRSQALMEARARTSSMKKSDREITITPKEWEAIQAHAVSTSVLKQLLENTDVEQVKHLATPRTNTAMSSAKVSKAKQMLNDGYTQSEVANSLGVSTSTLSKALSRKE